MRSALPSLLAAALSTITACAPTPYTIRIDGGYQTPVGADTAHEGYITGSAGGGVQLRNARGRISLTAEAVARPAANGVLFAVEGDLLGLRTWQRRYRSETSGVRRLDETAGFSLLARVAAGPAFGAHRQIAEASLGFGTYSDITVHDVSAEHGGIRHYFDLEAIEAFATLTTGDGHDDWMIGGRLSVTLPLNVVDLGLDRRRAKTRVPLEPAP